MRLLKSYLESNLQRMMDNNVRMKYIGHTHKLPAEVQEKMRWAEEATAGNTGTTLTLALNYSGRSELVDAFRGLAAEMQQKHLSAEHITEEDIHRHLYTAHMPDPDLLIRTSGEMRLSTCLLWQIAYTEIFFTERLWPDFAASICWKPSPNSSSASAATAASAKTAAKWKKGRTGQVNGLAVRSKANPRHESSPTRLDC